MDQQAVIRTRPYFEENNPYRFWKFQLAGWGVFFVLLCSWNLYMKPSWVSVITSIFAFVSGFVITSAYRAYIKKRNWTQLNPVQLVLPIIGSTVVISLIWTAAFLSFHNAVRLLFNMSSVFHIEAALEQAVNTTTVVFLWNLLYFSIYYIQLGQKSRIEKYKMEAEARKAQLNMLRSQINPHFMFNAFKQHQSVDLGGCPTV